MRLSKTASCFVFGSLLLLPFSVLFSVKDSVFVCDGVFSITSFNSCSVPPFSKNSVISLPIGRTMYLTDSASLASRSHISQACSIPGLSLSAMTITSLSFK